MYIHHPSIIKSSQQQYTSRWEFKSPPFIQNPTNQQHMKKWEFQEPTRYITFQQQQPFKRNFRNYFNYNQTRVKNIREWLIPLVMILSLELYLLDGSSKSPLNPLIFGQARGRMVQVLNLHQSSSRKLQCQVKMLSC